MRGEEGVEIPWRELSSEALRGVIEDFVLREGTDYGSREFSLNEKVQHVLRQLEEGSVQVVYDAVSNSCSIRNS